MKYTHLIYNSSEKNRAGGVGFGVRTATEGISDNLSNLLEQNEIFSFTECGEPITSGRLFDDPDTIRGIVPVYFFKALNLEDRSKAYVLGRKIAVGFDYTFYLNGKPGRLGNYVVDAYVFPEIPTAEEFEILLESAAEGSNSFIPKDPAPRPENEEMRAISTGHHPNLPIEERSFKASESPKVTPHVISLLFAFISAMKVGRPVLVKTDRDTPPAMMAALATLVPQEWIGNLTFLTNHADEGKKQGINIVFINEYYQYEIFKKQWVMLDLTSPTPFESEESLVFRPLVEKYLAEGNIKAVRNISGWCLSDLYYKSKDLSKETQTELFSYLYDYPSFHPHNLERDAALLRLLSDYLREHPEKKAPLIESLEKEYDDATDLESLCRWIDFIMAIRSIDTISLTDLHKEEMAKIIFADAKSFASFLRRYSKNWKEIHSRFLIPESFRNHNSFLSNLRPVEWEMLYPDFLAEFKGNKKYLIKRMLNDKLPADLFSRIIAKEIPDKEEYKLLLIDLLKENPGENEKRLISLSEEALLNDTKLPCDFLTLFGEKIDDPVYAPLYILQITKAPVSSVKDINAIYRMLTAFIPNPNSASWFESQKAKNLFLSIYNSIKRIVREKEISREDAKELTSDFFKKEFPKDSIRRFRLFYDALEHKESSDYGTKADLWNIAEEIGDMEYLSFLVTIQIPVILNRKPEDLHDLIGDYIEKGYITEEEALRLALANKKGGKHILKGIIRYRKGKPLEILDYLTQTVSMSEDEAMAYLEEMFPNTHKKILKSREPSVMEKVGGMFKSLFGKKKTAEQEEREEEKKPNKNNKKKR